MVRVLAVDEVVVVNLGEDLKGQVRMNWVAGAPEVIELNLKPFVNAPVQGVILIADLLRSRLLL